MGKLKKLDDLTLKDAIEVFTRYDLEHSKFPHNYFSEEWDIPYMRGLTLDDQNLILINKEQGKEDIRETILHELIHVKHFNKGDLTSKQTERQVVKETYEMYKKLYGVYPR